jgi:peptidase M23-like protein
VTTPRRHARAAGRPRPRAHSVLAMPRRARAAAALTAVLAAAPASAAAPRAVTSARLPSAGADPWRRPVDGAVARPFRFDPRQPFAAQRRRGVDLAAPPGAVVRAACAGRVSHAGPVPAHGLGVSIRCGELTATHLGLRALAVRRGARVGRGQPVGRLGASGVLRLGARVTAQRFGYLDPLALIEAERPRSRPPLGPVPRGVAPRRPAPRGLPPLGSTPRGRPTRVRARAPAAARPADPRAAARPPAPPRREPAASPHGGPPHRAPAVAWLGAALLACGLPLGGLMRARAVAAPRRARREVVVAGRRWSRPRAPAPPGGR